MHALLTSPQSRMPSRPSRFPNDEARWAAVRRRDPDAEGEFVFAVSTTGVYCRSSCAARPARRENVSFYATTLDAEAAGYRRGGDRDAVHGEEMTT